MEPSNTGSTSPCSSGFAYSQSFFFRSGRVIHFLILISIVNALLDPPKQLCFFKKAVKSLETAEPHVKSVTDQHHIDYHFIGIEGEDEDEDEDGDVDHDDESHDENDDGELSFDYAQNECEQDVSTFENSMKVTDYLL